MLSNFSRSIEYDKPRITLYNGPIGVLTITVEVIRSSLTRKWLLKTQKFEKKKGKLSSEEKILD